MIRVTDLEKRYGATAALRGVSFEVAEGRLAAIVGKSGAGKSTLLRCLIGLETFDRGSIRVGDVEVLSTMESTRRGRALPRTRCAAASAWCFNRSSCSRT